MIETTLSLQQAEELFRQEGVLFGTENTIPVFRAVELFGAAAGEWIEKNMGSQPHHLQGGRDYNGRGACTEGSPFIDFLYRPGFFKLVSDHNYRILAQQYKVSEGGRIWREIWQARCDRLDAEEAEEERKREERRAKRAAARKKKQEGEASA